MYEIPGNQMWGSEPSPYTQPDAQRDEKGRHEKPKGKQTTGKKAAEGKDETESKYTVKLVSASWFHSTREQSEGCPRHAAIVRCSSDGTIKSAEESSDALYVFVTPTTRSPAARAA